MRSGLSESSYIHELIVCAAMVLAVPRVGSDLSESSYIHVVLCLCSYGLAVPRVGSGLSGSSYIRVAHCLCWQCLEWGLASQGVVTYIAHCLCSNGAGGAASGVRPLRE